MKEKSIEVARYNIRDQRALVKGSKYFTYSTVPKYLATGIRIQFPRIKLINMQQT